MRSRRRRADLIAGALLTTLVVVALFPYAFMVTASFKDNAELYQNYFVPTAPYHMENYATAWAQAEKPIPCFGTTHADYFHGEVPVTARLSSSQITSEYERETGVAICERFRSLDPDRIPAVLVAGHAPFCWGPSPGEAAHNAVTLEYVARMAYHTLVINAESQPLMRELHDKHFLRKHGQNAYYGQVKK